MLRRIPTRFSVQVGAAILLAVAVAGAISFWRVVPVVGADTDRRFTDLVGRAATQVDRQVDGLQALSYTAAGVLAIQPGFASSLAAGDLPEALGVAAVLAADVTEAGAGGSAGGIAIYDRDGEILFRSHDPQNSVPAAVPEMVARSVREGTLSTVRIDEVLGLVSSGFAPVRTADGTLVGTVEVLTAIDEPFARAAAELAGTHVAVVGADGAISSSTARWRPTLEDIAPLGLSGTAGYVRASEEEFLAVSVPLTGSGGAALANIVVGVERSVVDAARGETRRGLAEGVLIAMVAGAAIAAGFGVLATRPFAALARSAQRIRANDLDSPVPRSGPHEAQQLAQALDEMRLAIREAREDLVRANRGLATTVETSSASLTAATQELSVLHAVVAQLATDGPDALSLVTEELCRLDWVDGAFVALANEQGRLAEAAQSNLNPTAVAAILVEIRDRFSREAIERGVFLEDVAAGATTRSLVPQGVGALAVLPLETPQGVAGVLGCVRHTAGTLEEPRRLLLRSIARELAVALERSELAEEVQESRHVAESVLREMEDGLILLDPSDRARICNPAAAAMLGMDRASIVGEPASAWLPLHTNALQVLRARVEHPEEAASPLLAEVGGRQLAFTAGPYAEADPEQRGMILLIRDLTGEQEADRIKRDFVSMVGHELRTPLTTIRTSIDLLSEQDAGKLNATQQRIVQMLRGNSDRLLQLINDLLDMSALDSGRVEVRPLTMRLADVVREVVESHRPEADEKAIILASEGDDGSGIPVWADHARVRQVLSNLLSNAVKYTPSGGRVTVRMVASDPFARVDVIDTGMGIPPAEQKHLFEMFFRTRAGERQSGGTGLGLAIARSIVELHGGEIWCESDGRSGSIFSFTLPRRAPGGNA